MARPTTLLVFRHDEKVNRGLPVHAGGLCTLVSASPVSRLSVLDGSVFVAPGAQGAAAGQTVLHVGPASHGAGLAAVEERQYHGS